MAVVVTKFGGTSVGTPERILAVARRLVERKRGGDDVVAVVSAMGKMTDELVRLAYEVAPRPSDREMDMLLSTGEQVSIALLAMAIQSLGCDSISFTGSQVGIVTDPVHTKAKIRQIDAARVEEALAEGKIVIVAGFQGMTSDGQITTLGRGGSDTTAVAVAAGIHADVCEIYTDVDGVYTADPRVCPKARKIDFISYEEMLEMAAAGAGVLQMRSVEFARNHGVVIHCRSSFHDRPGTIVKEADPTMEAAIISGVAYDSSEAKITIRGVPDIPGVAARIFTALADANVNVDMIIQNISEDGVTDISFTSPMDDLVRAREVLESVVTKLGARTYVIDESIAKVSLIGAGMRSNPGVAAKMFRTMAEANVNIDLISTSAIRISAVVDGDSVQTAVQALHTAFGLDEDAVIEEHQPSGEEKCR